MIGYINILDKFGIWFIYFHNMQYAVMLNLNSRVLQWREMTKAS